MADMPLSLDDAKRQLRLEFEDTDDDALIMGYIAAAVDHVERDTGLVLCRRAVTEPLAGFGDRLATWPIASIDAVAYRDASGIEQTLAADTYWRAAARPARLVPVRGCWSWRWAAAGSITVTMTAGYATADEVPASIIQVLKLLVTHWWQNRSAVEAGNAAQAVELPLAVDVLLRSHRLVSV